MFKGLEKDFVMYLGFDSHFEGINNTLWEYNKMYVAATRAKEHLVLVEYTNTKGEAAKFATMRKSKRYDKIENYQRTPVNVTDLFKHMHDDTSRIVSKLLKPVLLNSTTLKAEPSIIVGGRFPGTFELVSAIYGIALENAAYQLFGQRLPVISPRYYDRNSDAFKQIRRFLTKAPEQFDQHRQFWSFDGDRLVVGDNVWAFLVQRANAESAVRDGYFAQWYQITNYADWVENDVLSRALNNTVNLLYRVVVGDSSSLDGSRVTGSMKEKLQILKASVVVCQKNVGVYIQPKQGENERYLSGTLDFLVTPIAGPLANEPVVVELKLSKNNRPEFFMQSQVYASILMLKRTVAAHIHPPHDVHPPSNKKTTSFVLNACLGTLTQISFNGLEESGSTTSIVEENALNAYGLIHHLVAGRCATRAPKHSITTTPEAVKDVFSSWREREIGREIEREIEREKEMEKQREEQREKDRKVKESTEKREKAKRERIERWERRDTTLNTTVSL